MSRIKELYRKYIYGIMGTLVFHILLVGAFWLAELNAKIKPEKEETILLDFTQTKDDKELAKTEIDKKLLSQSGKESHQQTSNRAVNDAVTTKTKGDKFFDDSYKRDIEAAKKVVADVNKQLSKKITPRTKIKMPEVTTEGQDPDSIKNVIYSGKSNIHYLLQNRHHLRLPIPVYLAKNGGVVEVEIQVDRSGMVVKADVSSLKGDQMLSEYAIQAAEGTLFNPDSQAPLIQKGSITYNFVPQ